jgi:site-specific DNA-methyltransferase (adenine-specific)
MAHFSENAIPLKITHIHTRDKEVLLQAGKHFHDVCLVILPPIGSHTIGAPSPEIEVWLTELLLGLGEKATLIVIGETRELVQVVSALPIQGIFHHWIVIKRSTPRYTADHTILPEHHFGALVYTRYQGGLRHTKTRIGYTYCPICDKTTKDYGGKKHTYHEYGTLLSDVWRDIDCDLEGNLNPVIERFADLFGVHPYQNLLVLDGRQVQWDHEISGMVSSHNNAHQELPESQVDQLIAGDCLEILSTLPDNSIDFAFADPPYNLKKQYLTYQDELEITTYFEWCDRWMAELIRVLRPGRTIAVLNIPLWSVRHFQFLQQVAGFQNWIAWDALSYPVRKIMPAHYSILCFTKDKPRPIPGLINGSQLPDRWAMPSIPDPLLPMAEGFCLRETCIQQRRQQKVNDRGILTDLWWDIHRLKHNTRRVDHPCQLPPQLLYRLIALFTEPGEVVLDCFNGAGTTTLAAHQLGRRYLGIDISEEYIELARSRHVELQNGIDPFRKADRALTAKNSPVPRMPKRRYEIPKKTLQLEVKRIAEALGHLPTREEVIQYGRYPIRYYDEYFVSWGEVCAAARTTGMTEDRGNRNSLTQMHQLRLFDTSE